MPNRRRMMVPTWRRARSGRDIAEPANIVVGGLRRVVLTVLVFSGVSCGPVFPQNGGMKTRVATSSRRRLGHGVSATRYRWRSFPMRLQGPRKPSMGDNHYDLVAMTPTKKTSSLQKVKQLIAFHVNTHSVRSAFTYRKALVSSPHDINDSVD